MITTLCRQCGKELILPDGSEGFYSCEECHNKPNGMSFTDRVYSDDICKNKHHSNAQSNGANLKVKKQYDRQRVLEIIKNSEGVTSKEIARRLNKQLHEFSGRITELKADNIVEETGQKREGCAVYRLKENQLSIF